MPDFFLLFPPETCGPLYALRGIETLSSARGAEGCCACLVGCWAGWWWHTVLGCAVTAQSMCDIGTASSGAQHHSCPKTLPCAPPAVQRSAPASPVTTGTDFVFNLRSSSEISKSEGPIRENHHFISSLKCSHCWNDRRQCL